ncbi:hypothetical protein [Thermosulfurimonas sp. F29]|uniref:hypothetical protein n=1 Tax=Thermosulfurimonas sp. F29 TaxID=2867247 RepID=UPI001C82FD48|nr:hypothetical protein [Thermosulfurimonas sp. F29]MBX6423371.1 hypothetical protein [Thermosulfurimonas sp. F29]
MYRHWDGEDLCADDFPDDLCRLRDRAFSEPKSGEEEGDACEERADGMPVRDDREDLSEAAAQELWEKLTEEAYQHDPALGALMAGLRVQKVRKSCWFMRIRCGS